MESEKLVTIRRFRQGLEAYLSKSKLESEGIDCFVQDEHLISLNWLYSIAVGGVRLQVKSCDVKQAQEILEQQTEVKSRDILKTDKSITNCPKCNSDKIYYEKFARKKAFISQLLLSIPLPFLKRKWKCYSCGYEWKKG